MPRLPAKREREIGPTLRFAVTTAMTGTADDSGKLRYHFHRDHMPQLPKKKSVDRPAERLAYHPVPTRTGEVNAVEKGLRDPTGELPPGSPTGRLATAANQSTTDGYDLNAQGFGKRPSPVVRLATTIHSGALATENLERAVNSPTIKLAHVPGAQGDNNLVGQNGVPHLPDTSLPALLVSYYYLDQWEANKHKYHYRDWVMDSGAFSAYNSGVTINLQDYIACCKRLIRDDPSLTEVYSLDVIGSWEEGLANTEEMWRQGVPAIPCFHYGEPWELLLRLKRDYPKIAIGGCVGRRDKDEFAGQCFARVWPHKLHGFGFGSEKSIMRYPFHSVDATNWEMGPCAYGRWNAFGGKMSVRGSAQNLRAEVEWYLELERKARERWKKEMRKLEDLYPSNPLQVNPSVRLSGACDDVTDRRKVAFAAPAPTARLAVANTNPAVYDEKYVKALAQPQVRLAVEGSMNGDRTGLERERERAPSVRLAVDPNSGGYNELGEKRALRTFKKKENS